MAIDSTLNPERTDRTGTMLQHEELVRQEAYQPEEQMQQQMQQAAGVACPVCGTVNDPDAMFCATCGSPLKVGTCPNCGSELDLDADFCEVCHRYVRPDVCSFCGARVSDADAFCPECGSPRGGIVCPTCRTLNEFSFCKQCGTPLTDDARQIVEQLRQQPEFQELTRMARELNDLQMQLPYTSERDVMREEANEVLRERVLKLLAQDRGVQHPTIEPTTRKRMTKEELNRKKQAVMDKLTELLDGMSLPQQPSPAKARNYAMAQKPSGVRLAWVCNWKHAMHSSPCGCAKPQMGGKWVILGHSSKQEIKDDK